MSRFKCPGSFDRIYHFIPPTRYRHTDTRPPNLQLLVRFDAWPGLLAASLDGCAHYVPDRRNQLISTEEESDAMAPHETAICPSHTDVPTNSKIILYSTVLQSSSMRAPYQHSPASQVHYLSIGLFGQVSAGYCFKQRQAARGASRGRIQLNPFVCPACSATALPQSCWKLSGSCTRGRICACPYNPPQETTSQATERDTVKARNILQQSQPPAGLIVMETAMERESHSPVECPQCSHIFIPKQDCCTLQSTSNFAWTPRNAMAPTLHWCGLYCWADGGSIWLGGGPAVGGGTGCQVGQFGMSCCWWNWRHTS